MIVSKAIILVSGITLQPSYKSDTENFHQLDEMKKQIASLVITSRRPCSRPNSDVSPVLSVLLMAPGCLLIYKNTVMID